MEVDLRSRMPLFFRVHGAVTVLLGCVSYAFPWTWHAVFTDGDVANGIREGNGGRSMGFGDAPTDHAVGLRAPAAPPEGLSGGLAQVEAMMVVVRLYSALLVSQGCVGDAAHAEVARR